MAHWGQLPGLASPLHWGLRLWGLWLRWRGLALHWRYYWTPRAGSLVKSRTEPRKRWPSPKRTQCDLAGIDQRLAQPVADLGCSTA
jgi:hypothetical protein